MLNMHIFEIKPSNQHPPYIALHISKLVYKEDCQRVYKKNMSFVVTNKAGCRVAPTTFGL